MKIIDVKSEDAIFQLQEDIKTKQKEQLSKGNYTVDDFALVRTSNFLEEDHILKPICTIPFVTTITGVAWSAIFQLLKEQKNVDVFDEVAYEKFRELVKQYSPLSSQYRSTIHFTLNGLVSSHSKGNFDNQNFIIIDRLNKHIDGDSFKSLRMEDTFVDKSFNISNEGIILIDKNKYSELLKKYPWLESYNIVLFEGNEKLAVDFILLKMGITPENIQAHSAEYSERTPLYEESLSSISRQYGISREKHCYSKEYQNDDNKNILLWQIYDKYFFKSLFNFFNVNESKTMIEYLSSPKNDRNKQEEMLKKFILNIGIDKYCEFVLKYNQNIIEYIEEGIFPTNDQILEEQEITIKEKNKVL